MKFFKVTLALTCCVLTVKGQQPLPSDFKAEECVSQDFLSQAPTDEARAVINRGQRDFSDNLIKSMFGQLNSSDSTSDDVTSVSGNIFVSPSSIFQTMMLAYFGAEGQTEAELAAAMGFKGLTETDKKMIQKSYMFERAFQAVRENSDELGYKLIHA